MSWSLEHRLFSPVPPLELFKYSLLAPPPSTFQTFDGGTDAATEPSHSDLSSVLADVHPVEGSAPGATGGSLRGRRGSMRRRSSVASTGIIPKNIPETGSFECEKIDRSFDMAGENLVRDQLRGSESGPLEESAKAKVGLIPLLSMRQTQGSFHGSARSSSRASSFRRAALNNQEGADVTEDDKIRLKKLLAPRTMDAEKVQRKRRQKSSGGRKTLSSMMVRHGSVKVAGSDKGKTESQTR